MASPQLLLHVFRTLLLLVCVVSMSSLVSARLARAAGRDASPSQCGPERVGDSLLVEGQDVARPERGMPDFGSNALGSPGFELGLGPQVGLAALHTAACLGPSDGPSSAERARAPPLAP